MKRMIDGKVAEFFEQDAEINGANLTLGGNLEVDGNIQANGNITGASIVEDMGDGYSFTYTESDAVHENSPIYAGVCKNGNKLTIVYYTKIKVITDGSTRVVGTFALPSEVSDKLYTTTIGGEANKLFVGEIFMASSYNAGITANYWVDKHTNIGIDVVLRWSGASANTDYFVRFEITFLLSDNLVA